MVRHGGAAIRTRTLWRNWRPICDRVAHADLIESSEPQPATIAYAAGLIFELIAGPGEVERRFELCAATDDFAFAHVDDRGGDLDFRFWLGALADHPLEGFVILRAAVGITGTVFEDGADVDGVRVEDFGPGDGGREEVGIAGGDVGDGG